MQESRMGGIEYNSVHLAKAIDSSSFQIIFFCPCEGKLTRELKQNNLSYVLYKRPPFISTSTRIGKRYTFNPIATLYNFIIFFLIIPSLVGGLKKQKIQIVVCKGLLVNLYGALAARCAGIPCIWDMQEVVSKEKCFGLMRWILNLWAKLVQGIMVPSEAIRDQFSITTQKKIMLIPNGIDTDRYNPEVDRSIVRKEWGIKREEILIGHIARFTYWKGQKVFVQAAVEIVKQIPDAKFVLVGSPVFENDTYEKEVKKMVAESGFGHQFLFPGFRDDLANVIAALDIFVHSSIEPEGCPLTLLIAMGMGKPVIATKVQGNNEIIENDQQGIFVSPEKPEDIAQAVLRIVKDQAFSQNLSQQARERILDRYSIQAYARDAQAFLERIDAK